MAERQELQVVLRTVAQGQGAQQTANSLRQVTAAAAQSNAQTQQMARGLLASAAGFVSVTTAATALTAVFAASINAQRENERVVRATAAAYGTSASSFTRFAASLSQATGFTSQAILEAALSARTLSANYGLTIQQTQRLITASADLARVRGIGVAAAFERVQSAIRGEAEASEYLGLTLNDTFLKNNALNGSVRTTFERMTDAQKAQVRFDEVLRQTAVFKGLATSSVNSLDGAMLRAEASTDKLYLSLGKLTAPATITALQKLAGAAEGLEKALAPEGALGTIVRGGGPAIQSLPGRVVGARRDAATAARDAAIQAELELQQDTLQRLAQLQRPRPQGVWVTQAASQLRAGERQMESLRQLAYEDQRGAAIRDLLAAQREEAAIKEQITQMEKEHGDLTARRLQLELASINAQQRALPAQRALQDTERAIERARLVLGIRGTSAAERSAARGTIRDLSRNVAPGQRLAAFDAETGLLNANRAQQSFDLAARTGQIGTEQGIANLVTLANVSAARTDEAQARLAEIMQKAIEDGFLKRPAQQITLQLLNAEGQVTYEELIEATDQAQMPPVIRVSGVRR